MKKAESISVKLWSKALENELQKETTIGRYVGFSVYELPPPKWWQPAWMGRTDR